jgi:transcriptional regulator with XRE-family HTH domain
MLKSTHTPAQKLLCKSLKAAREEAGLTQKELADRLSEPQSFVSRFESGERRLDVVEYIHVSRALEIDPVALLRKIVRSSRNDQRDAR